MAVLRLPRISNSTDVEALACEPGVLVRWVREPADLADTDVIVLPGTKSTVADLAWLRERGLEQATRSHAASGRAVLGICGGFQMLCRSIDDPVESRSGRVEAMGMLDADIAFEPTRCCAAGRAHCTATKSTMGGWPAARRPPGSRWTERRRDTGAARCTARTGTACSTTTTFRRRWLTAAAAAAGRDGFVVADDTDVAARRDAQLDLMADLLDAHLDVDAVTGLLDDGPPRRSTIVAALR